MSRRLRLAGADVTVGPYRALNFPWILLDRALATLAYVTHRSHARRDSVDLSASRLVALLQREGLAVSRWSDDDRRTCERVFAQWRRGATGDVEAEETLRSIVRHHLDGVAAAPLPFDQAASDADA